MCWPLFIIYLESILVVLKGIVIPGKVFILTIIPIITVVSKRGIDMDMGWRNIQADVHIMVFLKVVTNNITDLMYVKRITTLLQRFGITEDTILRFSILVATKHTMGSGLDFAEL